MNEENYIAFENYINNEMQSDEKINFEEKLRTDASFKSNFDLYKETTSFIENKFDSKTIDFKANLESISQSHFSENKKEKSKVIQFKPLYYAVAASVAILFGTWFFMQNNVPQYGDYNQHENAMFIERGDIDTNLKEAQEAFNAKNYVKAVASFGKISDLKNPELQYFCAFS